MQHSRGVVPPAVQPRECGELGIGEQAVTGKTGSAPRVRGTHRKPVQVQSGYRFSPASAGNSSSSCRSASVIMVQPRECWELIKLNIERAEKYGSAPRVRGTRISMSVEESESRFSPASAGNSDLHCEGAKSSTVQPRECGELVPSRNFIFSSIGSAPRVRGTRSRGGGIGTAARFSPASAGNSRPCGRWIATTTVQPRECGELIEFREIQREVGGSAPRVRGTRRSCRSYRPPTRFSPASAGNSPP